MKLDIDTATVATTELRAALDALPAEWRAPVDFGRQVQRVINAGRALVGAERDDADASIFSALIARAKRCEELERLGATYASARTAWMAPSLYGATRPAAVAFEAAELALRNALTKEQP